MNTKSERMILSGAVFPSSFLNQSDSVFNDVKNLSRTSLILNRQNSTNKSTFERNNEISYVQHN
jgi:hypothetical protein